MTVFEELKRRGLIAQMTNEKEIEELVKKTKDEIILDEVKKELLPLLENVEQKYKGNNKIL